MSAKPTTILVVDDNPGSRYTIVKMLQKASYLVKEAATGTDALRLAAEKPDLVILDVGLPDLSGYEVCQKIRAEPATALIPVLHLSASFAETESRVRGLVGGADGYLTYPVEPAELVANVQALLRVREAEGQVREQRELLRVTLNSIGDGVIATDTSGQVTFINHVAECLTGWAQAEAAGTRVADIFQIIDEASGRCVENPVDRVIRDSKSVRIASHTLLIAKDNTRRPVEDTAAPIWDDDGNFLGVVLIFRDITQRRRAEQRQATQLAVTRILAESSGVLDAVPKVLAAIASTAGWDVGNFWSVERDGARLRRLSSWSAPAVAAAEFAAVSDGLFLLPGDSLPGRVWRTGRPAWNSNLARSAHRPSATAAARQEIHAAYAFPVPDTGPIVGVIEFFGHNDCPPDDVLEEMTTDVGRQLGQFLERNRLQEQLHARARELAAESQRKDEFLAMLSHELRNPLTPIHNAAQILRLAGNQGAAAREVVEMVERQVQHVTRFVDDLLNVSRVSQGKIELRNEEVDLATVVARAVEQVRPLVDDRGHSLAVTLPTRSVHLVGDVTRLVQIVANLLNNAAKYTDPGGRIALSAERENDQAVIRVRDNGIGIMADVLPHIFELFVQSERGLDRAQGGLGIGLTLAKSLVELHGGTITASSDGPGQGTEVVVRLRALPEGEVTHGAEQQERATQTIAPAARRRILIVDDNVDSAASLAILLQLQRHHVDVVHSGREAIEAVRAHRPEIVILDIGLPGMDGFEVARLLRQEYTPRDLVLVAMTGYGQAEDRRRSQEAGFNAHLVKPADLGALEKILAQGDSTAQAPGDTSGNAH